MTLEISPIAAFSDNYIWLISDGIRAVVVDPGDGEVVLKRLAEEKLTLDSILVTHHHPDHTGGIEVLLQHYSARVIGPRSKHIPQVTQPVSHDDHINVLGTSFTVLEIPGHTLDHIAFYAEPHEGNPLLFCGDTLFAGGCGRVFEGTPTQMLDSLDSLARLQPTTQVYCAHEYTESNLRFAIAVEPDNSDLKIRFDEVKQQRAINRATVPSTLVTELKTNPFLRCDQPSVKVGIEAMTHHPVTDRLATFTAVRRCKDSFK